MAPKEEPNWATRCFHPLVQPLRERQSQTPTLSFPDYLHLSKNYFRLGWSLNSHRRLKNLIIVMDWVPDMTVTFGEEDPEDEEGSLNPAHAELEDFLSTPKGDKAGEKSFLQSVTDAFQESVDAFAQATKRKRRIKSSWKPRELTKEQEAGLRPRSRSSTTPASAGSTSRS